MYHIIYISSLVVETCRRGRGRPPTFPIGTSLVPILTTHIRPMDTVWLTHMFLLRTAPVVQVRDGGGREKKMREIWISGRKTMAAWNGRKWVQGNHDRNRSRGICPTLALWAHHGECLFSLLCSSIPTYQHRIPELGTLTIFFAKSAVC